MTLPSYLQQSQGRALNDIATAGLGSAMPPHISIQGNTFTLIDAAGNEQPEGPALEVCIADLSEVICKRFYDQKWEPDSKDPPVCWSANGLAPSREASIPQSATCAACPNNVRGSATSAISGVAIKACRDERWLALIIPKYTGMRFQLILTPGSFKNWKAYLEKCKGSATDLKDIVTRLTFEPKVNGVLQFAAINYIDEPTAKAREACYAEKAFDVLVGRNDLPIQGALAGPTTATNQALAAPAPFVSSAAGPSAGSQTTAFTAPGGNASIASPSEPAPRRRRRTAAEIAADNAAQTAPAGNAAPLAPFRPSPPAGAQGTAFGDTAPATGFGGSPANPAAPGNTPGNTFGIQAGVPPNPEIQGAINALFGPK